MVMIINFFFPSRLLDDHRWRFVEAYVMQWKQVLLIDILGILTDSARLRRPEWDSEDKVAERLSPESIAQVSLFFFLKG